MSTYYTGKQAASYNKTWKVFSEKTLAATCSIIDLSYLLETARAQKRPPRILDVACGTGLLLQQLAHLVPQAELHGVDESQDMLALARQLLANNPRTHLIQASLTEKQMTDLPYQPASFDLITCTNAFHYLNEPIAVLRNLTTLLVPQGQLVVEDYARRTFPFPWRIFEWFIKQVDPQHVRAYTLTEARSLCQSAGLQITTAITFSIDLLWQGWAIAGRPRTGHSFVVAPLMAPGG